MTVRFDYLTPPGVMLMVYEGRSTNQQQMKLFQKLNATFGVGPYTSSISDMSALTSTEITAADMLSMSSMVLQALQYVEEPIKQALYTPTDMSYGIARMYLGFADLSPKLEIRLFDDLQAAVDWVGIPANAEALFAQRNWHIVED